MATVRPKCGVQSLLGWLSGHNISCKLSTNGTKYVLCMLKIFLVMILTVQSNVGSLCSCDVYDNQLEIRTNISHILFKSGISISKNPLALLDYSKQNYFYHNGCPLHFYGHVITWYDWKTTQSYIIVAGGKEQGPKCAS